MLFQRILTNLSAAAVVALAALSASMPSVAAFPEKPIRIVVGFAPGGSLDSLARSIAEGLQKRLGQTVIVENQTGAGGMLSAQNVARAEPDGYTLLMTAPGFMGASPHLFPDLKYDPVKSFTPISRLVVGPYLLAVRADLPVDDLTGFIALAKVKPGNISMANAGLGSATHIDSEYFAMNAGIQALHVPYRGSAPATQALLAGDVDSQLTDMSTLAQHVKSGRLKGLAITSLQRVTLLPAVPTAAEKAMPGFQSATWFGIVAPARTPKDVIDKLHAALTAHMTEREVVDKLARQGLIPATTSPAETATLIQSDIDRMGNVIKRANIKVQ
jgi:tripartite-type tricarboxylate transporter receptor subunit TctC